MGKFFKVLFCAIIVDFFFFSSQFFFTGRLNSKEILAVVGIVILVFDWIRKKRTFVTKEFIGLLVGSLLVSFAAYFSTLIHNTTERGYITYFMSMLVWLSAAFTSVRCVYWTHGRISVELLCKYIVFISVFQGLIAVGADMNETIHTFINFVAPSAAGVESVDRLHGMADTAALDTGGIRFAIASVLCMHIIRKKIDDKNTSAIPLYFLAFGIICVTGNMIARTTIVGTALGLAYLALHLIPQGAFISKAKAKALGYIVAETLVIFFFVSAIYQSNDKFYNRTRFAFEGFFSLVETGHWHTASNERLGSMYVWPDNPETWLIGDGYFSNPYWDMNYYGAFFEGYYKDTDVGYLRFIYFFGIIGLGIFSGFILYAGSVCMRKFPEKKLLMLLMTSMTFVIWLKVATDCFFILAFFICLGYTRDVIAPPEDWDDNVRSEGDGEHELSAV